MTGSNILSVVVVVVVLLVLAAVLFAFSKRKQPRR
ncbi:LPXTG cell wall anchor domain-containing protein [Bifidobacterium saguini]|nr:LPXTG cell wall anchor domain-containing protein [Bifidobacterium saguini]QTB90098.1 LPXTG cell wall anchor domain-containing protein [Bifidobacterium saguini]